jgi:hypothetical protein
MKKALIIVLSGSMFCTACSTTWVSTLDSILAIAAPALINILQIVAVANGQPVNSSLAAKISADATAIRTLAGDFAQASSGSISGVCQQLQAAVGVYEADQQLVLQVAQVGNPNTQAKIALLVDLVGSTVSAITAIIPSCRSAASSQEMKAMSPYKISTFVADYNRILVAPTGNASIDAITQRLKLHQRSKLVRLVTFGKPW